MRDRIAQEVLRRLLSPIFEPLFHENSFGFRPERNRHQAIARVLELWRQGYKHVLDADIQGFFDNIPHSVIMTGLANVVADGNILGLVERFLRAGVITQAEEALALVQRHLADELKLTRLRHLFAFGENARQVYGEVQN